MTQARIPEVFDAGQERMLQRIRQSLQDRLDGVVSEGDLEIMQLIDKIVERERVL